MRLLIRGDARRLPLADRSVDCVVTSPPYFGLRDYGCVHQLGREATPAAYVAALVEVFDELRRVLKPQGVCWLNLGDSYAGSWGNYGGQNRGRGTQRPIVKGSAAPNPAYDGLASWRPPTAAVDGLKPKDLCGIPWRVAFALQADGWYLRSDIIWAKPNPMPESVTDRPTKAHEYVFLLTKSERYFYDADAIAESVAAASIERAKYGLNSAHSGFNKDSRTGSGFERMRATGATMSDVGMVPADGRRNKRSVWTVSTMPYAGAHFATMPEALVEPCILAGCPLGGVVLDPFCGSGTVLAVAERLWRHGVGVDLTYQQLAAERTAQRGLPLGCE